MTVEIRANADFSLAEALEREAGLTRIGREVARRFAVHPDGHFLARDPDGTVLGGVSCLVYGPAPGGMPLAWIGGLVVRESARGRGVAGRLLDVALKHADTSEAAIVGLDASLDVVPLYEKRGFRPVAEITEWRRSPDAARHPLGGPGRAAIYPVSFSELLEVSGYDAPRFGASRAPLLAALLADHPERAFLAYDRETGRCVGYAMGGERGVGPLVADAADVAARLLYAVEQAGTPPEAHVPSVNPHAARVFREAGYVRDGEVCVRMVRGARDAPGREGEVFAIGAPAVG